MSSVPVEVSLVVSGVDFADEATLAIIDEQLDDLMWSRSAGTLTATVFAETDVVRSAVHAARRIHAALPNSRVERVDADLVTTTAIAARVGVSRQAVRQWVNGAAKPQFPAPFGVLEPEGKPVKVWRWADVTPWLWEVKGLKLEPLPSAAQMAAIDARLVQELAFAPRWETSRRGPSVLHAATPKQPRVHIEGRVA